MLALTTIFWGSLYTASKVLLDVIQPFTLLCLRWIDRFEHRFLMPSFDGFARVCQRIMVPMAVVVIVVAVPAYLAESRTDFRYGTSGFAPPGSQDRG